MNKNLIGIATSVRLPKKHPCESRTNAIAGLRNSSSVPTNTDVASAPIGIFCLTSDTVFERGALVLLGSSVCGANFTPGF